MHNTAPAPTHITLSGELLSRRPVRKYDIFIRRGTSRGIRGGYNYDWTAIRLDRRLTPARLQFDRARTHVEETKL